MKAERIKLWHLVAAVWVGLFMAAMSPLLPAEANPKIWNLLERWKTDFTKTSINLAEIISGGPPKDGIPAIDKPKFRPAGDITGLGLTEPVISFALGKDARAYPLRILMRHEIVNDVVNGRPVTVTYCPLCNSAIVFDRTINGQVHDFGVSGKLRNSDMVMYDRQTESWWQQFLGEAIVGKLTGTKLKTLPARLEAFGLFLKRYPDGKVLIPVRGRMEHYYNPYTKYDSAAKPFLFNGPLPKGINPMARVIAVEIGGKPRGIAMSLVVRKGSHEIGDVVLKWTQGQNSALDTSDISKGRDVGNITAQRKGPNGLKDIVYDVTFAFVFNAFHPNVEIVKQ